jgi:predicted nucleic acid-binding protein
MSEKSKIYVDSCCFIDAAKYQDIASAPADLQADLKYTQQILKASRDGDILVYTSSLTIAECTHVGQHPVPEEVKRLFKSVLSSGKVLQLISDSIFIAERARDLRWDHDITLRGADSIHVASALEIGCKEFVTNDGRGPHKNATKIAKLGIKVIRSSQSSLLPATYLEGLAQPSLFDHANGSNPTVEVQEGNKETPIESKEESKADEPASPVSESAEQGQSSGRKIIFRDGEQVEATEAESDS